MKRALNAASIQALAINFAPLAGVRAFLVFDLALNVFLGDDALVDQQFAHGINPFGVVTQFMLGVVMSVVVAHNISLSLWIEPVIVDIDEHLVSGALRLAKHFTMVEGDQIKRLLGHAVLAEGE